LSLILLNYQCSGRTSFYLFNYFFWRAPPASIHFLFSGSNISLYSHIARPESSSREFLRIKRQYRGAAELLFCYW